MTSLSKGVGKAIGHKGIGHRKILFLGILIIVMYSRAKEGRRSKRVKRAKGEEQWPSALLEILAMMMSFRMAPENSLSCLWRFAQIHITQLQLLR